MNYARPVAELTDCISLALGERPVDLLLANTRVVNVLSGEIHEADIAIAGDTIIGFGAYEARKVIDCKGRFACPGFIDGHIHIESTLLTPWEFARIAARHGTCAVVWDPHELANVLGRKGIEAMIGLTGQCPLSFYLMAPSCVPATDLETSGAQITAEDIALLFQRFPDRVLGLAEMMNYPGLLGKDPSVLAKIAAALGRPVDGHAPLMSGKELNAYVLAGPSSDHECTKPGEALEKLRNGLHLFMREGSDEKNLADLIGVVNRNNAHNISLVCDDRDPLDLSTNGHMDHNIRMAVSLGLEPVRALQMASINTARHFGMRRRGALAPGYRADVVLVEDLEAFGIWKTILSGREVDAIDFSPPDARQSRVCSGKPLAACDALRIGKTVNTGLSGGKLCEKRLEIVKASDEILVIGTVPGQVLTRALALRPSVRDGCAVADSPRDIAKLAVIERHGKNGNVGLGFIQGLGMAKGAIAGTVAHDSHNLIVAGINDEDMALAANTLIEAGGGYCVAAEGRILALLELPLAGLMSLRPYEEVAQAYKSLREAFGLIAAHPDAYTHPFMAMSFCSLPVIPELRITDKGLFDVVRFEHVSLWR